MELSGVPIDLILSKLAEDTGKSQARVQKASEVLLGPLETEIAQTPYDVVFKEDRVKLKHYPPKADSKKHVKTPLLVIYALINRETMLDLQPGRSVTQSLLSNGVDLYMIDWGYPTQKDKFLTIDDHVNGYIDNIVDVICDRHDVDSINIMGICMGGTMSVMYAALHPDKVKNLLIQSKLKIGGNLVDLKKITMPLLNFYGRFDHLVPPEACERLTGQVGSRDTQDICLETGHIGIYVSSKTQKEFVPKIIDWLKKRDNEQN